MAAVRGDSANPNEPAVLGTSTASDQGMGVYGTAARGSGVIGTSTDWIGVYGESANYDGVRGLSKSRDHAGVSAANEAGGRGSTPRARPPAASTATSRSAVRCRSRGSASPR